MRIKRGVKRETETENVFSGEMREEDGVGLETKLAAVWHGDACR